MIDKDWVNSKTTLTDQQASYIAILVLTPPDYIRYVVTDGSRG